MMDPQYGRRQEPMILCSFSITAKTKKPPDNLSKGFFTIIYKINSLLINREKVLEDYFLSYVSIFW
jgi:hypothetical protein